MRKLSARPAQFLACLRRALPACLASGLLLFGKPEMSQTFHSLQPESRLQFQLRMKSLLDLVASMPTEYKSDLGFTIIDLAPQGSLSPVQKRALLDDIFRSAMKAQYPYALMEASSQAHGEIIPGILGISKLDTLEIQTQVIESALPLMPKFAEQMFEEMKLKEDVRHVWTQMLKTSPRSIALPGE